MIASARSKSVLSDLEAMGIDTVSLDVTNRESIEEARGAVERLAGGRLDILVNNAWVLLFLSLLFLFSLSMSRAVFKLHVFKTLLLCFKFSFMF